MQKVDVRADIEYDLNEPEKTVIRTNLKPEGLEEVLEWWLQGQLGLGKDSREPVRKEKYLISIGVRLADDTFFTESDTGNAGLTCGLVMDVFGRLKDLKVEPL